MSNYLYAVVSSERDSREHSLPQVADWDDPAGVVASFHAAGWELISVVAMPSSKSLASWSREYYFRRQA